MVSVRDAPADKLVFKIKEEMKKIKEMEPTAWSKFVKSGVHKERPPEQDDFWYIRSASILRRLYLDSPIGIQRLRTYYGGRKKRGHAPARFRKASGNTIRKILQQLEKSGFVEKDGKGRKLTGKGRKFLDKIAFEVRKE